MGKKFLMTLLFIITSYLSSSYEVIDASGDSKIYNKAFKRIISLYPAHTEVLMDIGARGNLVGATREEGLDLGTDIVEFKLGDSIEKFLSLDPDLVVIRPMVENKYRNTMEVLRSQGVEVVSLHPKTSFEMKRYWLALGMLSGNLPEANQYLASFERELNELGRGSEKTKIFFEARNNRGIHTNSDRSIASYVLESAGVENILQRSSSRGSSLIKIREEKLLLKGEEIEVYIAQSGRMNNRSIEDIRKTNGFLLIKAVREGNILLVDERLMSRPTAKILEAIRLIKGHTGRR